MKPRIFLVSWMLVMTLLSLKLVILVTFEYHRPKGVDYMIRIIYFLVLLVLISSPVSAQITSSVNNFDNAKIIYYKSNPQSTFAKVLLTAKKMEFQFPVFVNRTDEETNYYHVLVPNDVLSEFKQVIQMQ
jgi:hypothetical protein